MKNIDAIQATIERVKSKYDVVYDELDETWNDFTIKECPNWRFGLYCYEDNEDTPKKELSYFCQNERNINKFKPSWSYIKKDITVYDDDIEQCGYWIHGIDYIMNSINFIHKHPIRAWAEDYYGYMANCIYVSSCKVFFQWVKYKLHEGKDNFIKNTLNKRLLRWFKRNIVPYIYEFSAVDEDNPPIKGKIRIFDFGEFNGYSVIYELDEQEERPHGFYNWFADVDKDCELSQKFDSFCDKYKKIAGFFGVYWSNPFDYSYQYLYEKEIPYEFASEV